MTPQSRLTICNYPENSAPRPRQCTAKYLPPTAWLAAGSTRPPGHGPTAAWHPMSKKLGSLSKYPFSLPHSLSLDKACSPVFSPHLFQGSCLPYAPLRLSRAVAAAGSRTAHHQHKQDANSRPSPGLVLVLLASPPPLLPSFPAAWTLGARIQLPSIQICAPHADTSSPMANHY